MVEDRIADGRRIAQLLASELDGREGPFAGLSVTDARPDVEPTEDGARAYDVVRDGATLGTVYVHPDRVRVELLADPERALSAARDAGLRARPKAVDPPRTLVFVESGAAVKRASDVVAAALGDGVTGPGV
jgi:hypothetical protein